MGTPASRWRRECTETVRRAQRHGTRRGARYHRNSLHVHDLRTRLPSSTVGARVLPWFPAMTRLSLDQVRTALPELDELRPIFEELLRRSEADDSRTWAGSGQLGTVGSRVVGTGALADVTASLARREAERLASTYAKVAEALEALSEGDPEAAARAFLDVAAEEERLDHAERAFAYAEAAYRAVQDSRDRTTASLATRRAARALKAMGRLTQAFHRYRTGYDLAIGMSDARGAAEAAVGAGNVLEEQGRWEEAEAWYRTALKSLQDADAPSPERWHALLTLHIVARSRGAIEESIPLLEEASAAAAALGDESATPYVENARGQLLMAQGEYGDARQAFRSALDAAADARARIVIRLNLAESHLAAGRTLDAMEHARDAERETIRSRTVTKLPEVYRLLGRIAAAEDNPEAFVLFERALEIVRDYGLPAMEEALTLQAYAEAERRKGETEVAESLLERAKGLFSMSGADAVRQRWADVFGPARDDDIPAQGRE